MRKGRQKVRPRDRGQPHSCCHLDCEVDDSGLVYAADAARELCRKLPELGVIFDASRRLDSRRERANAEFCDGKKYVAI